MIVAIEVFAYELFLWLRSNIMKHIELQIQMSLCEICPKNQTDSTTSFYDWLKTSSDDCTYR